MNMKGKIAIVTGAGRGMGKSIARMLAEEGANVALVSRTQEDIRALKKEIMQDFGIEAIDIQCDISDENQVKKMVKKVYDVAGPPGILVNNAGVPTKKPTEVTDYSTEEWDRIIDVNLRGTFFCCRETLTYMREAQSGTIINVSSISGIKAAPNVLPYSVSKFGMMGLNQTLIAENMKYGIKIHAVCPGVTDTSIWDRKEVPLPDEVRKKMIKPEEIADIVKFLINLPENIRIDELVVLPNKFPVQLWDYKQLE